MFIKWTSSGFAIVAVYVDDMNIIGSADEIKEAANYLKSEFEMKDMGRTRFCLGLELEHREGGIFVHQSAQALQHGQSNASYRHSHGSKKSGY